MVVVHACSLCVPEQEARVGCGCEVVVYCHGCGRLCCYGHHSPVEQAIQLPAELVEVVKARLAARPGAQAACPRQPVAVGGVPPYRR